MERQKIVPRSGVTNRGQMAPLGGGMRLYPQPCSGHKLYKTDKKKKNISMGADMPGRGATGHKRLGTTAPANSRPFSKRNTDLHFI